MRCPIACFSSTRRPAACGARSTQLPFDQRAVIVLREIDGLSYEEIAASLGVAVGTVKSRLARARETLRLALRPHDEPLDVRLAFASHLGAFVDGELAGAEMLRVSQHLDACADCAARSRGAARTRRPAARARSADDRAAAARRAGRAA